MTRHLSDKNLAELDAHLDSGAPPEALKLTPPKKHRKNEESAMQRALIKWWQANCRRLGVPELCLFSIPNGFNGDARRGSVMKAEGQRKGVPDLMLAAAKDVVVVDGIGPSSTCWMANYHCLFLELKTPTGRLSPEQEVYHEILANQGYKVVVCRSFDECVNAITEYLK